MTPEFDVFRNDKSNEVTWLTAVNTLAEGEAYVHKLVADAPGGYFIFSQKNGTRQIINAILSPNTNMVPRLPATHVRALLREMILPRIKLA